MQSFLELVVGVFLCCFGLYEKIVDCILNFFKDIKNNLKFIFPIVCGALIGVFALGNLLKLAYNKFYMEASFVFIGLILGSLKLVMKQSNINNITLPHFLCLLLTFSFSIYLVVLERTLNISSNLDSNSYLILAGIIMSAGVVIPGVSKTVILMMFGLYEIYLSAISTINLSILIPIVIGMTIGGILFLLVINFLFKIAKSYTYFAIIGFILGSVFVIYPGFTFNLEGLISLILLIISFIIGLKLSDL